MSKLTSILVKLLPMLYKLATQIWYKLSPAQRNAATQAVKAVEWFKKNLNLYDAGYLASQANKLFKVNLPIEQITAFQVKLKSKLTDLEYNQELKKFGEILTAELTPEPIDWKYYALGIVQIAYEETFKK